MILVTSPDGNNGITIVESLLAKGLAVKALIRKEGDDADIREKVGERSGELTFAIGDYDDRASLEAAMAGCDGLVILVPFHENMQRWEEALVDAAQATGIGHVVKFSEVGAQLSSPVRFLAAHGASDRHLLQSGVSFTIVRVNDLMQNLILLKDSVREKGEIYSGIGDARISWVDLQDVADAIAGIFAAPNEHRGHTYDLTGPAAVSLDEIAKAMTDVLGKPVRHVPMSAEEFGELTGEARGNEWYGKGMVEIQNWIREGWPTAFVTANVKLLTGREPTDVASFVTGNADAFN